MTGRAGVRAAARAGVHAAARAGVHAAARTGVHAAARAGVQAAACAGVRAAARRGIGAAARGGGGVPALRDAVTTVLIIWRHPRPTGAAGRCIGRTDLPVDRRKAKRLAHRIRAVARRQGLPRRVATSPLDRAAAVGRILARWGFVHAVDRRLAELDFGDWDGRPWDAIGAAAVGAWTDDFVDHAPGGGEPVASLLARCAAFLADPARPALAVGHAGWISAARWLAAHPASPPTAADWPTAIGYGLPSSFAR